MEEKNSKSYEKLAETSTPPKSPKSPLRPFRLKFHRMLSTGSLKLGSHSSPGTPSPLSSSSDGKHYSFDCESMDFIRSQSGLRIKHGVPMKKIGSKKKFHSFLRKNRKRKVKESNECVNQLVPIIKLSLVSDNEGSSSAENSRPNSLNLSKKLRSSLRYATFYCR
ncbi:rap GTPase activating protein 1 isoform X2 [Leptinotarsa decemlineata]|uniref:rap GTPase activating protein 1 isoform X2 n=1 Tax=Leptinotarsa decemlineata TaxID=7539 RepID=UPI003D3094F3